MQDLGRDEGEFYWTMFGAVGMKNHSWTVPTTELATITVAIPRTLESFAKLQFRCVNREMFVWLVGTLQQDGWKFAITIRGAQCAMTCGMWMMLEWSAGSSACHHYFLLQSAMPGLARDWEQ
jgi:hypothetical protein